MNEGIILLGIEEGLDYYLWLKEKVIIHYKLGDMVILLEYQFLAVCATGCYMWLLGWMCSYSKFIPKIQSMSSNSIRARRYHDFTWVSIFGYLIIVEGQLLAFNLCMGI